MAGFTTVFNFISDVIEHAAKTPQFNRAEKFLDKSKGELSRLENNYTEFFKNVLHSEDVITYFEFHGKYGRPPGHGYKITTLFTEIVRVLPEREILRFGQLIANDRVCKITARGERASRQLVDISIMLKNCPQQQKLKLFVALDQGGLLPQVIGLASYDLVTSFFTRAFTGIDNETVLNITQHSKTFANITDSQELREEFVLLGIEFLLPILGNAQSGHQ